MHQRFEKKGINIKAMALSFKKLVFALLCYDPDQRMSIT